jgi:benzoyl-CoA reductase subunit BamC
MRIRIDHTQCCGCKLCEVACSLKHTDGVNPQRSRIKVYLEETFCLPVIAGPFTEAGCNSRQEILVHGVEMDGCIGCRASCPEKSVYKEPDTGIPLKCDFCGDPPDPECVKWCAADALVLVDD